MSEPYVPLKPDHPDGNDGRFAVVYRMTGADLCPGKTNLMSFELELSCSRTRNDTVLPESRPTFLYEQTNCVYRLGMTSIHACPKAADGTGPGNPASPLLGMDGCTFGNKYTLAPLRTTTSNWAAETPDDTFYLNVCGPLVAEGNGPDRRCPSGSAVCGIAKKDGTQPRSLGRQGILTVEDGILTLTYRDGDKCADGVARTTIIRFSCGSGQSDGLKVVEGQSTCGKTVFEWRSRVGCDLTASGVGFGTIFGWLIFSLLLAYFLGRFLINRFRHGMPGAEAIPHIDFFVNAIEWMRSKLNRQGRIRL